VDSRSQFARFRFSNAIGYAKFYSRSHDAVFAFTMTLATWLKRTSTTANSKSGKLSKWLTGLRSSRSASLSSRSVAGCNNRSMNFDDRRSVGEFLSIYQAIIAMVSLFTGFVFVGLLQLLTASDPLDAWRVAIIWLLSIALVALTTALLCFHTHAPLHS
jgi:hypothetical protein